MHVVLHTDGCRFVCGWRRTQECDVNEGGTTAHVDKRDEITKTRSSERETETDSWCEEEPEEEESGNEGYMGSTFAPTKYGVAENRTGRRRSLGDRTTTGQQMHVCVRALKYFIARCPIKDF